MGSNQRDQDRSPAAPDVKRVIRQLADHVGPKFGFKVDVKDAAYWWSRVATAAVRGAHYPLGRELASWLLLVADDLAMIVTHSKIRESVLMHWSSSV